MKREKFEMPKAELSTSPLLIGGAPRSGTTALLQVLNSNPKTYISSEENLLNMYKVLTKSLGTRERRAASLAGGMRELSVRETLTADNIHSHNFTEKSVWPAIRYIYKFHHKRLAGDQELILWGDKLPNYYKELPKLLSVPNVRYLHITRNPYDVINSMLRRTEMSKHGKDWWKAITEVEEMISAWAEAYQAICKVEARSNVLHIQYENLVFNFDETIASMNAFFGVDHDYENMMVDDPDKHYDRAFLNDEIRLAIAQNPHVAAYVGRFNCDKHPMVAASLANL